MSPAERSRRGLSLKFQITAILPELTVYDNLLLALQAHQSLWGLLLSRSRQRLDAEVMDMLAQFRLTGKAHSLAGEMSHGEQQWLEIAMALALKPKLLLLDEPTGGMSPEERRVTGELLEPIRDYCALVIVEHDLDFIKDICDNLTVLDQGQVLDDGTVAEIEDRPRFRRSTQPVSDKILDVKNLNSGYGHSQVIFDLSMSAPRTGCVAILGRNGAGKTTLLKTLAGELKAMSGDIDFDGMAAAGVGTEKRVRHGMGYVPQEHAVFAKLSVQDNLNLGAVTQKDKSGIDKVLDFFPKLSQRLSQPAGTCPGASGRCLPSGARC